MSAATKDPSTKIIIVVNQYLRATAAVIEMPIDVRETGAWRVVSICVWDGCGGL